MICLRYLKEADEESIVDRARINVLAAMVRLRM